jgi:O-antigen ligase
VAPSRDGIIVKLFCAWVFLQSFQYQELPYLRLNVGIVLTPDRIALFALVLMCMIRGKSRRPWPATFAAKMLGRFLILFAVIGISSWLTAGADAASTKFAELTHLYCLVLLPALTYYLATRLRYTRAMLTQVLWFFALFGAYLSITAFFEHYRIDSLVFPKYILDPHVGIQYGRSRGPYVDTIGDGGMLLLSFACVSCITVFANGSKRVLGLLIALLAVPAVYFTETRSIWLGLGLIIATLAVLKTPARKTGAIICGVVLVAFVAGIGSKFSISGDTLFSRRQNTVEARFDNYEIAWRAFNAHPVFGLGYGKLKAEWSHYFSASNSYLGIGLDDGNHSTILGILAELGIVGAVPYLLIVACAAIVCVNAYRGVGGEEWAFERQFVVVALGAVEAYFMLSLTNDLKSQPTLNASAFWLVGMANSLLGARVAAKAAASPERGVPMAQSRRLARAR